MQGGELHSHGAFTRALSDCGQAYEPPVASIIGAVLLEAPPFDGAPPVEDAPPLEIPGAPPVPKKLAGSPQVPADIPAIPRQIPPTHA